MMGSQNDNWLARGLGLAAGTAVSTTAGWIIYSALGIDHDLHLLPALDAGRYTLDDREAGELSYYQDRQGTGLPLLLIHSINAAASAYEMRPLFEHYRGRRPVFALDLPGFGFSGRPYRRYTPDLYAWAVLSLLEHVVGEPADLVALSLGSEFAARAAVARPEWVHSLALISPSGMGAPRADVASSPAERAQRRRRIQRVLSFRLWAQPLYDLIATRTSIRYFLQQSFAGPVDDGLADYAYLTSHQPGARHAPLYFLSGRLFTEDAVGQLYMRVKQPSLVLYDRDAFVRFDRLSELVEQGASWRAERIPGTLGLPHFEKLDETAAALDAFWAGLGV